MGLTTFLNCGDDVVGVVLQGVIRRCCGGRVAPVVVDAETTAHIEKTHGSPEACQFDVDLPGLLKGILEYGDVVDLASDMKVKQP